PILTLRAIALALRVGLAFIDASPYRARASRAAAHAISASPRSTLPVSTTVRIIAEYAAHRQICPASAAFTSFTDGFGFLSRRPFAVTSQPAVQKPQSAATYM